MTTFEEYAANRPKPTLPRWYSAYTGPIGTLFVTMLLYDAARSDYAEKRDKIAAHLKRRAGGDTGLND